MSVLAAARDLAPQLAARAAEIEEARRLPADLANAMAEARLFRLAIPKSLDGEELRPDRMVEVLEAVAEGDASAGWCLMIGATTALVAAYLPRHHAEEVLGPRDVITGGVFAPMGRAVAEDGHYRVSGRWAWASGSANCRWLVGGSVILEDGAPRRDDQGRPVHRMMLMPRESVALLDTWHAAGLKGTGSGDMAAQDVAVPQDRSVSLIDDRPREAGALYRFPAFGLLAIGIAGVASGNARAALDGVAAALVEKKGPTGRSAAERATVQAELAKADGALFAARAGLMAAIAEGWREAEGGGIRLATRARLRLAATHLTRTAADVTRVAYDLGGGGALYLESPLQRRFRDAHAMTQHIMVQPATFELAGRVFLGQPADTSML
ncbi:MAG: acyl-CoA dehydrogenase family protein [Sphingomonadaceae bacterium]